MVERYNFDMKRIILALINFYRKYLSRTIFKKNQCSFNETCSKYAIRVYSNKNNGIKYSTLMTLRRLQRCHDHYIAIYKGNLIWEDIYDDRPYEIIKYCANLDSFYCEREDIIFSILANYILVQRFLKKDIVISEIKKLISDNGYHINESESYVKRISHNSILNEIMSGGLWCLLLIGGCVLLNYTIKDHVVVICILICIILLLFYFLIAYSGFIA